MSISTHKAASVTILIREAKARVFKQCPSSMSSPSPVLWTSSSLLLSPLRNPYAHLLMPALESTFLKKWGLVKDCFPTPHIRPSTPNSITITNSIKLTTHGTTYNRLNYGIAGQEGQLQFCVYTNEEGRTFILKRGHDNEPTEVCSLTFGNIISVYSPEDYKNGKGADGLLHFFYGDNSRTAWYGPILPHPEFPNLTSGPLL